MNLDVMKNGIPAGTMVAITSSKQPTTMYYIESLDRGIQNALDQMTNAPRGAVVSASDVIGMLSIFKNQTMEAKLKAFKGEIK